MIIGISVAALILSVIALCVGIAAFIELRSFNKSTHNIQYVPTSGGVNYDELGFEILSENSKEKLREDDLDM